MPEPAARATTPAISPDSGRSALAVAECGPATTSSPSQPTPNTCRGLAEKLRHAARLKLKAFHNASPLFFAMIGLLIASINSAKNSARSGDSALLSAYAAILLHTFAAIHAFRWASPYLALPVAESSADTWNQFDDALATSYLLRFAANVTFSISLALSGFVLFDHYAYIVLCFALSFLSLLVFTYELLKAPSQVMKMLERRNSRRRSDSIV